MVSRLISRLIISLATLLVLSTLLVSRNNLSDRYSLSRHSSLFPSNNANDGKQLAFVDATHNCDRCLVSPEWCAEFGSKNIDRSVAYEGEQFIAPYYTGHVLDSNCHQGTGDRIRRAVEKSERGEPIKFGIIGGSLSRGHGCHCTTFHRQIFDCAPIQLLLICNTDKLQGGTRRIPIQTTSMWTDL